MKMSGIRGLLVIMTSALTLAITACGSSGGSGSAGSAPPTISSVSPNSAPVGSVDFTITVTGANFDSRCYVVFNGAALNTTFVSAEQLESQVTTANVSIGGVVSVSVYDPTISGTSNSVQFTIVNPAPTISSISPFSAPAGGAALTIVVNGSGFVPTSTVLWNGEALPTSYRGSTLLWATLSATDISNPGTFSIAVETPSPSGGNSSALEFQVFSYTQVNETANDIVWDPQDQLLYLSVPTTSAVNPGSITAVDPFTNANATSLAIGGGPDALAISDNGQYLYAGIDGTNSVQRFVLPGIQSDISFTLGSGPYGAYFALAMQVAPADPITTAIILGNKGTNPVAEGGVVIYDNATPRPERPPGYDSNGEEYDFLQWGANASTLYAANSYDLFVLSINSSGAVLANTYKSIFNGFGAGIHYDPGNGLIYDDNGQMVDPTKGVVVGQLPIGPFTGVMTIDPALNRAYVVSQPGVDGYVLQSFNLTQFTPVSIVSIPQINGTPARLIRWGTQGLAMIDSSGAVYLISGPFVTE